MSLVSATAIDLSDLCPELKDLYQKLRPYIRVRLQTYIPGVGLWETIWALKDDELCPIREGTDLSELTLDIPTLKGDLAELHSRITLDRLLLIMTFSDYLEMSMLWRSLIRLKGTDELLEYLESQVPENIGSECEIDFWDVSEESSEEELSLEDLRVARLRYFSNLVT